MGCVGFGVPLGGVGLGVGAEVDRYTMCEQTFKRKKEMCIYNMNSRGVVGLLGWLVGFGVPLEGVGLGVGAEI